MARLRWASDFADTACGTGGAENNDNVQSEQGGPGNGHIVYGEVFAPAAAWALESNDAHPRAGCLETLIRYGTDAELEPSLAEEWSQVDPKTWEFRLREGVKLQDWITVDSEAVAGALTHLLEVKIPARALNPDAVSAVEAVDEVTVQVTTPAADQLVRQAIQLAADTEAIVASQRLRRHRSACRRSVRARYSVGRPAGHHRGTPGQRVPLHRARHALGQLRRRAAVPGATSSTRPASCSPTAPATAATTSPTTATRAPTR